MNWLQRSRVFLLILVVLSLPAQSSQAAGARQQVVPEESPGQASASEAQKLQEGAERPPGQSGVEIIVVEAEGIGSDLKRATNEALRSAVSQVFGEQFATEMRTDDLSLVGEITGTGLATGVAGDLSVEQNSVSSQASGLIESYKYLKRDDVEKGVLVVLEVRLPKYETGIDPESTRVVVLRPRLGGSAASVAGDFDVFVDALQDELEGLLNDSKKLTVLDREFIPDQMRELDFVASGNAPTTELARLGNTAGADVVIITEVVSFDQALDVRTVGGQEIRRTIFNLEISVKVVDVATTNVILTQRFPFRRQKTKATEPASDMGQKVARRLARRLASKMGGGLSAEQGLASEPPVDVESSRRRASESYEATKESVKEEW